MIKKHVVFRLISFGTLKYDYVIKTGEMFIFLPLINTAKKIVISPNFVVWKFYEKAQFPYISELPETMQKLYLSKKFPHQEIR